MTQSSQARQLAAPDDPLGETLHLLALEGTLYGQSELTAPWSFELPPLGDCLMFHVVTSGRCELLVNGERHALERGSMALVPHGQGHVLCSDTEIAPTPFFDIPVDKITERYEYLRFGGGGEYTGMMCGVARFDHVAAEHLIAQLPPVIVTETWNMTEHSWLNTVLACMADEAKAMRPGGETIVTRLADVLVIYMIRAWLEKHQRESQVGWLAGLRDPQIGTAMVAVQRDPARAWSLASLASEVHMSRSAFAARFTEVVGEPAMRYVTRWRMRLARSRLREQDATLAQLADELGYGSEASFCRAFKREFGVSPGRARAGDLEPAEAS
jgi:AraC-like DNA-binding protein